MVLTSIKAIRLIRGKNKGEGGMEVGEERDYIHISLHCHHQKDSYIKMGRNESHFVSLIVRDEVTRQCPKPQSL